MNILNGKDSIIKTGGYEGSIHIDGKEVKIGNHTESVSYGIAMVPHRLAKRFFESVTGMDHVDVYGDFGTGDRLPIVAINVKSMTSVQLKPRMLKD